MGLFGGGNSSSSTTNETQNIDRRIALDNQSQGISGDGNSISVTATDYQAVASAIGAANGAVVGANKSLSDALTVTDNSLSINAGVMRDALAATTAATRDAITAVSQSNSQSLNFASTVNKDSLALASTINRDALDLASRGQTLIANSAAEALGMVGHVVDSAFSLNDKNVKSTMEAVANSNSLVGRAYETATAYQAEKQTADSKYLLIAALAAVAIVAVRVLK